MLICGKSQAVLRGTSADHRSRSKWPYYSLGSRSLCLGHSVLHRRKGGATPTYVTTPLEPVATPVPPVLPFQKHTHILSVGAEDTMPPLPVVTDKTILLPAWPESHHVDVDSSEPSVIHVPYCLPEFWRSMGGVIKMNPSHRATRVKVHSGPHARCSRPDKALTDTSSPQSFVWCSLLESMLASGAASPSAVPNVPASVNGPDLMGFS